MEDGGEGKPYTEQKSFKIMVFLLLFWGFAVSGVAAANTECNHVLEDKEAHVESGRVNLQWHLQQRILMLRICVKVEGQETYKNGLCPLRFYPLKTISYQGPQFLGNKSQHYNEYERCLFVGNLSIGDASFSVNVTGDVFVGNYTFLALVRLDGDSKATCHRNLTIYHLQLKGHDKSSSTPPAPSKQGKTVTGHDKSSSTPPAPSKQGKTVTGYYHGIIIAAAVMMFLVLEVLSLVIIGMCYQQHQEVHF